MTGDEGKKRSDVAECVRCAAEALLRAVEGRRSLIPVKDGLYLLEEAEEEARPFKKGVINASSSLKSLNLPE